MKKLLSICLSAILVLVLAPSAISGATTTEPIEVLTTGTTLVEAEDYPENAEGTINGAPNAVTTQIKNSGDASGGAYLFSDNYGNGNNKTHSWSIDFEIPADGTYTVKTRIGKIWKYRLHDPIKATFGDEVIVQWGWSDRISDSSNVEELAECEKDVTLEAGTTYTFKLETGSAGANHHLYIDYVSVTPKDIELPTPGPEETTDPIEVSTTETTLVEAENYPGNAKGTIDGESNTVTTQIKNSSDASGGAYLFSDNYGSGTNKTHNWSIDFEIPTDGTYTVKTRIGKVWKSRTHNPVKATFGDEVIVQWEWSDRISDSSEVEELAECEKDVTLTAGTTYTFKLETGAGYGGNHHLYIDYVSVTPKDVELPTPEPEVPVTITTINATDYPTATAYYADGSSATIAPESSGYIAGAIKFSEVAESVEWLVPVTVEKAGRYKVTFEVSGGSATASRSLKEAIVNDVVVGTVTTGSYNTLETLIAEVTLNQGENLLGIRAYERSADGACDFEVKSISYEDISNPGAVEITEETKFEAEDYRWIKQVNAEGVETDVYIPDENIYASSELEGCSGEGWVRYNAENYSKAYSTIDITIPVAGIYELKYYARNSGTYSSTNNLLVDGVSIYTMPTSSDDYDDFDTYTTNYMFSEGNHTLGYQTEKGWNTNCYFAYDYISIKPVSVATPIEVTGETTIQGEAYAFTYLKSGDAEAEMKVATIKEDITGASGEKYLFADNGGDVENAKHYWEVVLDIKATDVYKITALIPEATQGLFHSGKVVIDETVLYEDKEVKTELDFAEKIATAYLTEGEHILRYYVEKGTDNKQQLFVDAVTISPVTEATADTKATGFDVADGAFAGDDVTVSYTYVGTNAEGDSILSLFYKDGEEWKLSTSKTVTSENATINLSESLIGKQIKIELIPVDEKGIMGPIYSEDLGTLLAAIEVTPNFVKNTDTSKYEATVEIEFNAQGKRDILIIIAQYDEDGAMLGYDPADVMYVELNTGDDFTGVNAKTLDVSFKPNVASAQLFVWSGTDITSLNDTAYIDTISR